MTTSCSHKTTSCPHKTRNYRWSSHSKSLRSCPPPTTMSGQLGCRLQAPWSRCAFRRWSATLHGPARRSSHARLPAHPDRPRRDAMPGAPSR
jgi:hypothetical protein